MKMQLVLLGFILLSIPFNSLSAGLEPQDNPEELLKRAAEEISGINGLADQTNLRRMLHVARDLARFDKPASKKLLKQAFRSAKATEDVVLRLWKLELVALHAAPIDEKLSTDALMLIKRPEDEDYEATIRVQLKLLAIDAVLAYRQGLPGKGRALSKAKHFCKEHRKIREWDLMTNSSSELASYVSLLDPALGIRLWKGVGYSEGWKHRLKIANDLVHYGSELALPELRSLFRSASSERGRMTVAAALYSAGAREETLAVIKRVKHASVGVGSPLGDLIIHIARSDPDQAAQIALAMGSKDGIRDAMTLVFRGAAKTRPKDIPALLKHMDNKHRRSTALLLAAQSLVKMGDLESARVMADKITIQKHKAVALATIAGFSKNLPLMEEALKITLEKDEYGSELRAAVQAAARALGVEQSENLLVDLFPNILTGWTDTRIFAALLVIADRDPEWALRAFSAFTLELI